MGDLQINPDDTIYFSLGWITINATIVSTWITMAVLTGSAWFVGRNMSRSVSPSRLQSFLELIVTSIQGQIREISHQSATSFLPFIGTLFLLIAGGTLLAIVPWLSSPTASLSTTAALATCVFFGVPVFGIRSRGWLEYLRQYARPTWFMLPFNIISELSRTLALAIRLYGNMMSGAVIAAVLLTFVPLLVPVVMQLLGLITGMIQAYIFAVLAMVYIASASAAQRQTGVGPIDETNFTTRKRTLPSASQHGVPPNG